jgi:hypothetical protein
MLAPKRYAFPYFCEKEARTVSEGDLGHCDKFFSFNLIFYSAAKNILFWIGIIF